MKLSTILRLNKQDVQFSPEGLTFRLNSVSYRKLHLALVYHTERYGDKIIQVREATEEEALGESQWKLNKDDVFYIITVGGHQDYVEHTE